MELNEQLAVITALDKAVAAKKKEVRAEADAEMMAHYEDMGVEKMALRLGGEKVGELGVVMASESYTITDAEAFEEFALCNGLAEVEQRIAPDMMPSVIKALGDYFDSEVLDEIIEERVVPVDGWQKRLHMVGGIPCLGSEPVPGVEYVKPRVKNTVVRGCKPEAVLPIVAQLGGVEQLLLGEGSHE